MDLNSKLHEYLSGGMAMVFTPLKKVPVSVSTGAKPFSNTKQLHTQSFNTAYNTCPKKSRF